MLMCLQRREVLPQRRSSPSRRVSSDAEHASPVLAPGFESLLEARALLDHAVEAAVVSVPQAADGSLQQLPAEPPKQAAAAGAAPALQPTAHAMPGMAGTPGGPALQPQLSQGQAELLAQVHMAKNNRAARAGSSAPAISAAQLRQALQHVPAAGKVAHSSEPAIPHMSKATAGIASAPTQQVQPSQSTMAAPTTLPAASSQQQLPVTPTRNRTAQPSPRPRGRPLAQQQQQQQEYPLSPASSAQQLSAANATKAAANSRIMTELASWHQQSQQQQQQLLLQRLVKEQMLHARPQQQRPNLPESSVAPATEVPASIAHTAQHSDPAAVQQTLAAVQAFGAAQGRAALPAISSEAAVSVGAQQRPIPVVSPSHQGVPAVGTGAITNATQQRPTLGISLSHQGVPSASSGAVRIVPQQRPTLLVSSSQQGTSYHGVVTGQLPGSAPAGQPVSGGPARFPAPFQAPALRPSGPRPQYFAAASAAQSAARPPGSAMQRPQLYASAAGPASGPMFQQHIPETHAPPSQSPPSTGIAAKGQAYPVYMFYPDGATPHSQQQGQPPGQSTATTSAHLSQSQPAAPGVVARAVANMQARSTGPGAGQHPAPAQVSGQKRAAEPVSVQNASAAKQPRTSSAQTPLQQLLQPTSGQLALSAAAQSQPPAVAMPAPAAPSTELAFVEALMVISRPTSTTSELLHPAPACGRRRCRNIAGLRLRNLVCAAWQDLPRASCSATVDFASSTCPWGKVLCLSKYSDCKCCNLLQVANAHGPKLITELRSERERNSRLVVRYPSSVT